MLGCGDTEQQMLTPVVQSVVEETPAEAPTAVTVDTPAVYSQYDVNLDGTVNNEDLKLVSAAIGQTSPANPRVDVDGSGTVDGADLLLINANIGTDVATSQPVVEEIPTVEETPAEELPLELPVDFSDIDLPEQTIPEGADVVETDRIVHLTGDQIRGKTFESAREAIADVEVIGYFEDVKQWAIEDCGSVVVSEAPGSSIRFTTRAEREIFKGILGDLFRAEYETVEIVDGTHVYYGMEVGPASSNPCDLISN